MLSSICASRRCILACVKFRSRVLTALNLLPSIATLASLNSSRRRHSITNSRQTLRMASPLSLRKSAIVLKSGIRRPVSHTNSMLRWHSRSRRSEEHTSELQSHRDLHSFPTRRSSDLGLAVVLAKIGNRLEVRHQATSQPHQLDVALALTLQ